jgi:hypothetical protein
MGAFGARIFQKLRTKRIETGVKDIKEVFDLPLPGQSGEKMWPIRTEICACQNANLDAPTAPCACPNRLEDTMPIVSPRDDTIGIVIHSLRAALPVLWG